MDSESSPLSAVRPIGTFVDDHEPASFFFFVDYGGRVMLFRFAILSFVPADRGHCMDRD